MKKTNSQILNEIAHLLPQTYRVQDWWTQLQEHWDSSTPIRLYGFLTGLECAGLIDMDTLREADDLLEGLTHE